MPFGCGQVQSLELRRRELRRPWQPRQLRLPRRLPLRRQRVHKPRTLRATLSDVMLSLSDMMLTLSHAS